MSARCCSPNDSRQWSEDSNLDWTHNKESHLFLFWENLSGNIVLFHHYFIVDDHQVSGLGLGGGGGWGGQVINSRKIQQANI